MKRLLLVLACLVPAFSQSNPAKLPVNRVVLYKNGVGYFEHTGSITGTQDLTVDFTSAQLNDALKSLTILDQGEGRITGVRYNSATPLEQQLNTLHLTLAKDITYADLLTALRGSRVEVREKALATTGRIRRPLITVAGTMDGLLPIDHHARAYARKVAETQAASDDDDGDSKPAYRLYEVQNGNHIETFKGSFAQLEFIEPHAQRAFDLLVGFVEEHKALPPSQCIPRTPPTDKTLISIEAKPSQPGHCASLLAP